MAIEVVHTIGTGGGRDYSSISAWESDQDRDLVAADEIAVAECYNDGLMTDTITLYNWTTDAAHYIKIYAPQSERHNGTKDTGFTLTVSSAQNIIRIKQKHVRIEGIAFKAYNDGTTMKCIYIESQSSADIRISHCLFYSEVAGPAYNSKGIHLYYGNGFKIWNNFFFNLGKAIHSEAATDVNAENNTAFDCYMCYQLASNSLNNVFINNIGFTHSSTSFYQRTWFAAGSDYNIDNTSTSTYQAPGTNSLHNKVPADNLVDVTRGTADLHIKANVVDVIDAGTASVNIVFTDDIDGDSRLQGVGWDMGADEYVASGPSQVEKTLQADAIIRVSPLLTYLTDAIVLARLTPDYTIDTTVVSRLSSTLLTDVIVKQAVESTFTLDSIIRAAAEQSVNIDAIVKTLKDTGASIDVVVQVAEAIAHTLYMDADYTDAYSVDGSFGYPVAGEEPFTQLGTTVDIHIYYRNDSGNALQNVTVKATEKYDKQVGDQSMWWKIARTQVELDGVSAGDILVLGDYLPGETDDFWIRITVPLEQDIGTYIDVVLRIEGVSA